MAHFSVIDTGSGADTFYEGMVKDAANWAVIEAMLAGTANYKMFYNAGGTSVEWATGHAIIQATRDLTAAGAPTDVAYTGVGFKPSLIIMYGGIDNTSIFSIGTSSGLIADNRANTPGTYHVLNNYICQFWTGATDRQYAVIKTYDADGFTLTWTKANSPTGTVLLYFICFR